MATFDNNCVSLRSAHSSVPLCTRAMAESFVVSSLIDEALSETRSALRNRTTVTTLVTALALILILTQLAFRAWAVYGGWFFGDDLVFLSDVAQGKGDLAWLFHRHNVHFMPVGLLLVLPVAHAGPFAWNVAAAEMLIIQAIASLTCLWMLRTLFGNRLRILVPLAFYLFAAISMPSLMWWSAGLNMLTVQPVIFAAITAHVLYARTTRKRYALLAAMLVAVGLLCYVKALLIPAVLGIVTLCYFSRGPFLRRLLTTLQRFWFAWLLYAALDVTYLVAYFSIGDSPADKGKVDYLEVLQHSVVSGLGTGVLGGPWKWLPARVENGPRMLADPPQLLQTLSISLIVLTLIYLWCRYQGALKPLYFLVPCVVVTVALLAEGRVATFGTAITMEMRYWTDSLPYLSLAIGLMCMPLLGSNDPLKPRNPPLITVSASPWLKAGFATAFLAGALYSSVTYVEAWHKDYQARSFITTASNELKSQNGPVDLADESVPEGVMQSIAFPDNLTSRVLAPLNNYFRTPDMGTDLKVLSGFGQVVAGIASPDLDVPADSLTTCLTGQADGSPASVPLPSTTYNYPFWMSVTYRASSDAQFPLVAGSNWRHVPIQQGQHTLFLRMEGSYDRVDFYLPPDESMCIESLRIGKQVVPR